MRLKILRFKVKQLHMFHEAWSIIRWITKKPQIQPLYHFEVLLQYEPAQPNTRPVSEGDIIELPNTVRIKVYRADRSFIRGTTTKLIYENLREYRPMTAYVVYPRVHGHLNEKSI